jgi:hypothetical protein
MDDLIEPIRAAGAGARPKKAAAGGSSAEPPSPGLGSLRPKRARITGGDK